MVDLGRRIASASGAEFDPEMEPPRLGEVQRISIDPALAGRDLGWSAAYDLDSGLAITTDWFRS